MSSKSDPYYFVWSMGLLGPEPAIVMEPWIPKRGLLFKVKLEPIEINFNQLQLKYPAPVPTD